MLSYHQCQLLIPRIADLERKLRRRHDLYDVKRCPADVVPNHFQLKKKKDDRVHITVTITSITVVIFHQCV